MKRVDPAHAGPRPGPRLLLVRLMNGLETGDAAQARRARRELANLGIRITISRSRPDLFATKGGRA